MSTRALYGYRRSNHVRSARTLPGEMIKREVSLESIMKWRQQNAWIGEWLNGMDQLLGTTTLLSPRWGRGIRCNKGSSENIVTNVRVILTELDSASQM
jgi:hypothetical protein